VPCNKSRPADQYSTKSRMPLGRTGAVLCAAPIESLKHIAKQNSAQNNNRTLVQRRWPGSVFVIGTSGEAMASIFSRIRT
jgi:hypothetical protein